jgi:purine-binding chemotaxis protein CheW
MNQHINRSPSSSGNDKKELQSGEIKFISFKLVGEEFGIETDQVKEILNLSEITPVPKSPDYLLGMMNLRGTIIPILDLRLRLRQEKGQSTSKTRILVINVANDLSGIVVDEVLEVQRLDKNVIEEPPNVTRGIDKFFLQGVAKLPGTQRLIMMLNLEEVLNIEIEKGSKVPVEKEIQTREKGIVEEELLAIFSLGSEEFGIPVDAVKEILRVSEITAVPNVPDYVKGIQNLRDTVLPIIDLRILMGMEELQEPLQDPDRDFKRDQRILILDIAGATIGLLVDQVNQVARLPKSIIDITPAILSSYGKEICGIAKLNGGTRLVLLLDETALLSSSEMDAIATITDSQKEQTEPVTEISERQLVVFSVVGEEFGISIANVREIFKPDQITPVPKAPGFIKGVINLRGSIIPVVDVQERFEVSPDSTGRHLLAREHVNDNGRILVAHINDTIVGLLVESVQEVLRIRENCIENAPSLVLSNVDTGYLEGVAKLDDGQRIILLLNTSEIMNKKEMLTLNSLKNKPLKLQEMKNGK